MDRREALIKSTWLLKATVFAPAIIPAIQGCSPGELEQEELKVFNQVQNELIKAIAETIIPRTETVGASDVKVNLFLDLILKDVFSKEETKQFLSGLAEFDKVCQASTGSTFAILSVDEQSKYLTVIDKEVMSETYAEKVPFYYSFKHLVTTIYFSSAEGVKRNLNYQPVPGSFQGEVPYLAGEKMMVGNNM
jgi:hypothetical protein